MCEHRISHIHHVVIPIAQPARQTAMVALDRKGCSHNETYVLPAFQSPLQSTHPIEEEAEVLSREGVEGSCGEDVEEAQLQVLQRLLLTRHHPAGRTRIELTKSKVEMIQELTRRI